MGRRLLGNGKNAALLRGRKRMMYVHHYLLTLRDCRALRLTDGYSLHRAVYALFPDVRKGASGPSGILFADKGGRDGLRRILILSDREALAPEHGRLESRELGEDFLAFPRYRFELVVNAVRKKRQTRTGTRARRRGGMVSGKGSLLGFCPSRAFRTGGGHHGGRLSQG